MEELLVALHRDSHPGRPGSCQRNRRHSILSLQVSRGSNTREKEEKEDHVSGHMILHGINKGYRKKNCRGGWS